MRVAITKLGETPLGPIFPTTIAKLGTAPQTASPNSKVQKQDGILPNSGSQPGDEDARPRPGKTVQNSRMFFRLCGLLGL